MFWQRRQVKKIFSGHFLRDNLITAADIGKLLRTFFVGMRPSFPGALGIERMEIHSYCLFIEISSTSIPR
jgi:hypothetical protein